MTDRLNPNRIEFTKVDLAVIDFRPGDIAVLMWPRRLDADDMRYVLDLWRKQFPGIKCLVLDDGARLGVIRAVA